MIDAGRLARAVYLDAEPIEGGRWRVSGGSAPHVVDAEGSRCDCADFGYRHATCKHRLAVRLRRGDLSVLRSLRELVTYPKR